jgi:hypothetical protein
VWLPEFIENHLLINRFINLFQNPRTAGSGSLEKKTNPRMINQQWVLIADCTKVLSLHFCVIKDYKRKMGLQ